MLIIYNLKFILIEKKQQIYKTKMKLIEEHIFVTVIINENLDETIIHNQTPTLMIQIRNT